MTTFPFDMKAGPRIHAFLIATGAYRAAQAPDASIKLRPLPGVARSALDFADFLVERSDKLFRPLGSIELLVSDPAGPVTWRGRSVDEPTMANIRPALRGWLERLGVDEKSMAVFYAGGHGCYQAGIHYFTEDAGAWGDPLDETIRLDGFQSGMSTKRCAFQWFIFDCCQDLPETIARQLHPTSGTTLLGTDADQVREVGQLRIEAASPGRKAYSGEKTHLMDALEVALKNDAARPVENGWGAKPNALMEAMNGYGQATYGDDWAVCSVKSNAAELDYLHQLDSPPRVAVTLRTKPPIAFPDAAVKLTRIGASEIVNDVDGNPCDWPPSNAASRQVTVYGDYYEAKAHFEPGSGFKDKGMPILPVPRDYKVSIAPEKSDDP